jgi:hypothetical protein
MKKGEILMFLFMSVVCDGLTISLRQQHHHNYYYPFQNLRPTNHPTTISQKQNWWGAACSSEKPSLHKIWLLLRFGLSSSYQNSQHQNGPCNLLLLNKRKLCSLTF